jgi:hypothetical protein
MVDCYTILLISNIVRSGGQVGEVWWEEEVERKGEVEA